MAEYTEKIERHVTLTHSGTKEVREVTIVCRDGQELGRSNRRYIINAEEDVPDDIRDHIEQRKGKQR